MTYILLNLLVFFSIFSSILVITSKNPVIAVIFLISVFINAAVYLIILGVGFVGISYLILYVGAITVLFLFVIMLINIKLSDILEAGSQYTKNIPLAFVLASLFIYEFFNLYLMDQITISNTFSGGDIYGLFMVILNFMNTIILNSDYTITTIYESLNFSSLIDGNITYNLQIQSLGQEIYGHGAILLIVSSVILLLAMIAPIFISRNNHNISINTLKIDSNNK